MSNSSSGGGASSVAQPTGAVCIVDKNGELELPLLGKFKAAGLTTDSLKYLIEQKTGEYYKTPAVIVRFANLRVNVLGEVLKPGIYILSNEKNTIFDALGMAGDLTIFAKRENILLIRDSSGFSTMQRFSLNNRNLLKQDYFYLKQNDVVYVEPSLTKAAALDTKRTQQIAIFASVLSLLIVMASRL